MQCHWDSILQILTVSLGARRPAADGNPYIAQTCIVKAYVASLEGNVNANGDNESTWC